MSAPSPPASIALPFAVAALGIALFSGMDAVMKHLALSLGTYNAMLWRTMAGAIVGGVVMVAMGTPRPGRAALRIHLIRGVLAAVMGLLFFWGLARVPMAQGIALAFVAPLIALFLAAVILKERIERRAILVSLVGFAGVIVILLGQARADFGPEALLGSFSILASACLYAYNIILMRQQAQIARPLEIAFYMSAIMTGCFLLAAPVLAQVPPAHEWPLVLLAAVLAFGSLILLSWAYARAQAQHLAPVEYTGFVWAAFFGFLVFGERVQPLTVAGGAMIVFACLAATRRGRAPLIAAEIETGLPGGAV